MSYDVTHLTEAIRDLKNSVDRMSERQEEMVEDVKKIKEAVYNPESGLYARIRVLEQWKESTSKIQWAAILALVGLVTAAFWNNIVSI